MCSLLSFMGYKGSSLLICFLILQMYPHNPEDRAIKRSEKWCCGSPDAVPGTKSDQSQFLQLEDDRNLCPPLPGWLLWSPAYSITFSTKTRNEAVLCTQHKGNNLGAVVCFRRGISGSFRYNGRKAINLNLFQTRPQHLNLRKLVQVWNTQLGGRRCYLSPFIQLESRFPVYHTPQNVVLKNLRCVDSECELCFLKEYFIWRTFHQQHLIKFPQIISIFSLNAAISDNNKYLINGKYNCKLSSKFFSCGHGSHSGEKVVQCYKCTKFGP